MKRPDKALCRTAIPLRSIAADELGHGHDHHMGLLLRYQLRNQRLSDLLHRTAAI